jgi:manganese transport protein
MKLPDGLKLQKILLYYGYTWFRLAFSFLILLLLHCVQTIRSKSKIDIHNHSPHSLKLNFSESDKLKRECCRDC